MGENEKYIEEHHGRGWSLHDGLYYLAVVVARLLDFLKEEK